MRRSAFVMLALVAGCDGEPADSIGDVQLGFFVSGTKVPLQDGDELEIILRPQGVYGAHVDLHIVGMAAAEIPEFSIGLVGPDGHVLAHQPFLPTSTAYELEDGSIAIDELPVVFGDDVDPAEVEGAPATLGAELATTPPVRGEVEVVLRYVE